MCSYDGQDRQASRDGYWPTMSWVSDIKCFSSWRISLLGCTSPSTIKYKWHTLNLEAKWITNTLWCDVIHQTHRSRYNKNTTGSFLLPFWTCTSASALHCEACGPAALCCPGSSPYRSGPASALKWTPPPGAWTWCPCCQSLRYVSGRSQVESGSPAGKQGRFSLDWLVSG